MLYEPPKTKRYILVFGATVITLAVLAVVAIPLLYNDKTIQAPGNNILSKKKIQQDKIRKEFGKLEAMRKSTNVKQPTQEEIQKEFDELEKQRAQSNAIPPTPEEIQAEFDKLEKMKK